MNLEAASNLTVKDVERALKCDSHSGLSTVEADNRRAIHGLNEFSLKRSDPLWKKYLEQFKNPFIILLLVSAVISIFMGQFDDAASITFAIIIVVTVGFVQEYRSEKTLERMGALLPPVCRCLRDCRVESIYAKYLVPGDVVELNIGDRIPADLRLMDSTELYIDESSFTGETEPVRKTSDVKYGVRNMTNVCFLGTLVSSGHGKGIVICTGEKSQFGEVFQMMRAEDSPRTPLQESMEKLGKQLSLYSLIVIGMIMSIGWLKGRPALEMFNVGVSLAVAAIPEGLPIVVTVTLALGVMRMANRNAVVKRLPTVEALGCVDYICSDKTGTLTSNEMTVYCLQTPGSLMNGSAANDMEEERLSLMEVALLCNNSYGTKGTPTERALYNYSIRNGLGFQEEKQRIEEVPFTSERKYMSVTYESKGVKQIFVKGALDVVTGMCAYIEDKKLDAESLYKIKCCNEQMAKKGLRVIAFAKGISPKSLVFMGMIGLTDPPRPKVKESINILQASDVNICMITGDSRETAVAIADMLGIHRDDKIIIGGDDLDKMSDKELGDMAEKVSVYYRSSPRHKLRIIKALQSKDHIVAMTGDGVNDGVAVKKADVGISMGISGTDVCKEAADIILLDDDFSTILAAIEEGKCIFYNIRNFVRFQLSTSISALILLSLSTILGIPNPLNPMQILWINVIMDGPPAQSLGLEPVDHEVLRRPPRKKREEILTKSLLANVLFSASIIISGTLWVFKEMLEDGKITPHDTTMTFTCFVFFDMFNALSCRSQERLIWEIGFLSNKFFSTAVVLSVLGQLAVIYLPPFQYIFQTESLEFKDLVLLVCLSSSVFILSEMKKFLSRYNFSVKSKKIKAYLV